MARNTVLSLAKKVGEGHRVTMVTSYDYTMATLVEESGIDMILVGDSLGMTMLGYEDTIPVTLDDMVHHTRAVTRATHDTFVVGDLPFGTYQASPEQALSSAARLMKEGCCQAVKLEGGTRVEAQIRAIVNAGIPVVGHIGMTPQSSNAFGGFKVQGKTVEAARRLVDDALAVERAGAFAVVLECVPSELAAYVTERLTSCLTIGIGAGADCDGQVLVCQDLLGMTTGGFKPRFVRNFAQVGQVIRDAYHDYAAAVEDGSFPAAENGFKIDASVMDEIREG